MSTTENHDKISEEALRRMLKDFPEAPASPWFTRKVLNRLPEKSRRMAMRIEYGVYIFGLLWMFVWGVILVVRASTQGVIVADLITYMGWLGVCGALVYALVEPQFTIAAARREARRQHNELSDPANK